VGSGVNILVGKTKWKEIRAVPRFRWHSIVKIDLK